MRIGPLLGAPAVLLALATPARADLGHDLERVDRRWGTTHTVRRTRPFLLERGQTRLLNAPRAAVDTAAPGCTTVLVLGVPGASFLLRFPVGRAEPDRLPPQASVAGAVELVRCGEARAELEDLVVEGRSPRVVLEVRFALGADAAPPLEVVLPHRRSGALPPVQERTTGLVAAPVVARAEAAVARGEREGAEEVLRSTMTAGQRGEGETELGLIAGCHRLHLLTDAARHEQGVDLDLDLVDLGGNVLASDRTESPDATVDLCVGQRTVARLLFRGAPPGATVTLVRAIWHLPSGLPGRHAPEARAALAEAASPALFGALGAPPVLESLGVPGLTLVPAEVVPGACYVAVVARWSGALSRLALAVRGGPLVGLNQSAYLTRGTRVAFCGPADGRALLEVEARGELDASWVLALFRATPPRLGEEEP